MSMLQTKHFVSFDDRKISFAVDLMHTNHKITIKILLMQTI